MSRMLLAAIAILSTNGVVLAQGAPLVLGEGARVRSWSLGNRMPVSAKVSWHKGDTLIVRLAPAYKRDSTLLLSQLDSLRVGVRREPTGIARGMFRGMFAGALTAGLVSFVIPRGGPEPGFQKGIETIYAFSGGGVLGAIIGAVYGGLPRTRWVSVFIAPR